MPEDSATAVSASNSERAITTMFAVWQAMSPRAPVPKSSQPRHWNGW